MVTISGELGIGNVATPGGGGAIGLVPVKNGAGAPVYVGLNHILVEKGATVDGDGGGKDPPGVAVLVANNLVNAGSGCGAAILLLL